MLSGVLRLHLISEDTSTVIHLCCLPWVWEEEVASCVHLFAIRGLDPLCGCLPALISYELIGSWTL